MKKIMMLLAAAMLVFSFSGQAAAYFGEGSLIQVVYERGGTKEIVTDLGTEWALSNPYGGALVTEPTNISLSKLGAANWDNVYVAYFMRNVAGGIVQVWTSGENTGQVAKGSAGQAFIGKVGSLAGANAQTGVAQNINLQADPNSFASLFAGTAGTFAGFLTTATGEANLAALGTGGSVDQYLYFYNNPTNRSLTYTGVAIASLDTFAAKSDVSAVPIPAAVYLFGSGLLGLIGIRRRMSA